MDKAGVQDAFTKAGLSRVIKDIDLIALPSIRLFTTPAKEGSLTKGASKLGGMPDLPPGFEWPQWKKVPQSFIAQIRLEDVQLYDVEKVLPPKGMLWFFYDTAQETYGDNPDDKGAWLVLFKDDNLDTLQPASAPAALPKKSRFKPCSIRFAQEITLPQQPELLLPNFDWTDEEQQKYEDLLSTFPDPADRAQPRNRMLGNSDTIQDDMHLQSQLYSNGITDMDDPKVQELSKGANDWLLLLQVDSDHQAGMQWASTGMLYYWIKKEDLQAHNFEHTWLVLQSE